MCFIPHEYHVKFSVELVITNKYQLSILTHMQNIKVIHELTCASRENPMPRTNFHDALFFSKTNGEMIYQCTFVLASAHWIDSST